MTTTHWIIGLAVAFLSGGAMGAIINTIATSYRNRIQPVGVHQEIIDIIRKEDGTLPTVARLVVRENPFRMGAEKTVENLTLSRITLTNRGNQDFEKFVFGISVPEGTLIIDFRATAPDRYHVMKAVTSRTPEDPVPEPVTEMDFKIEPFNRADTYSLDVYLTYEVEAGEITFSTAQPVKFVNVSMAGEVVKILGLSIGRVLVEKTGVGVEIGRSHR
jgi:hypothetical protein